MDKMALVFTLVHKDYTEPPGNTAQKIDQSVDQSINSLSVPPDS